VPEEEAVAVIQFNREMIHSPFVKSQLKNKEGAEEDRHHKVGDIEG